MNYITIILGSITKASKVRRMLSGAGITADLVKSARGESAECAHGIRIHECDMYRAAMILRNNGIDYTVDNDLSG